MNRKQYLQFDKNSRPVLGFHPLFHESVLAQLFQPLLASFWKENITIHVVKKIVNWCLVLKTPKYNPIILKGGNVSMCFEQEQSRGN